MLKPVVCGESVCLTVDEVKALVAWEAELRLVRRAAEGCSLLEWVPE